jgi:hypothetical protein
MTQPEAEEFIEYGYLVEYPDGTRDAVSLLGEAPWPSKQAEFEQESALGMFRAIQHGDPETRHVFVSRRVTRTPWTDGETSTHD